MSTLRAVAGNRTLLDRNRVDDAIHADAPVSGAGFPAVLGAAANPVDASIARDLAAALQIEEKTKHPDGTAGNSLVTGEAGNSSNTPTKDAALLAILDATTGHADAPSAGDRATATQVEPKTRHPSATQADRSGSNLEMAAITVENGNSVNALANTANLPVLRPATNPANTFLSGAAATPSAIEGNAKYLGGARTGDSGSGLTAASGSALDTLADAPLAGDPATAPQIEVKASRPNTTRVNDPAKNLGTASGRSADAVTRGTALRSLFGAAISPADVPLSRDLSTAPQIEASDAHLATSSGSSAEPSTSGATIPAFLAAATTPADLPLAGDPASASQSEVKTKPSNATRVNDAGASQGTTSGSPADALEKDRTPSLIEDSVGQAGGDSHHHIRQSPPHRADGAEVAAATISWSFPDSSPAAPSPTDESTGASAVSHVGSATPLSDWKELAVAQDPSAQSASTVSATAEQALEPHGGGLGKDVSSADSLVLGIGLSAPLEHDSGSDLLPRPLVKEIPSVATADLLPVSSGATLREQAALHSTLPSGLATEATSNLVGTAGPSATQTGGGSPVPETSLVDLVDSLSHHLLRLAGGDTHEVVLQLHPPELGDVTVGVLVNGRDVSAWFVSSQAQVQQVISEAIGQLHTSLDSAGYNLSGTWIGADARGPGQWDGTSSTPQPRRSLANRPSADEGSHLPTLSPASGISVYV